MSKTEKTSANKDKDLDLDDLDPRGSGKTKAFANVVLVDSPLNMNKEYHRESCHGIPVGNAVVIGKAGKGCKF